MTNARSRKGRRLLSLLLLSAFVLAGGGVGAEDEAAFVKRKNAAIDKGAAWLKKVQAADGSFDYENKPFNMLPHMKQGCTALGAFALLKSGVSPSDPAVTRAFDSIHKQKLEHVYSAGCILLAIEARANWEPPRNNDAPAPPPPPPPSGGTKQADGSGKDNKDAGGGGRGLREPRDMDLAKKCVDFLVASQAKNVWRYPMMQSEDTSASQYALLGLDAGERLGIPVPKDTYKKAQAYFVMYQEAEGPEVSPFPVPGADKSYAELKKVEKELREKIKRIDASFKGRKPGELNADGHTEEDELRAAEEAAGKTVTRPKDPDKGTASRMHARGWCYAYAPKGTTTNTDPVDQDMAPWKKEITGSLTASACACLFICKAHLEGTPDYEKGLREPIDKSLRDGAAWLAEHFTVKENPGRPVLHHYYYMYGLERAGILGCVGRFGEHDWYDEGSHMFLEAQRADGSWCELEGGTGGPVLDTCFALLFLSRGTTPVVRIPTTVTTGGQ